MVVLWKYRAMLPRWTFRSNTLKCNVIYTFSGKNLPLEKLENAVKMSEETYCGVGAVYRKVMEVTSEIRIVEP
jgi:uncharacterized OsmC-like protein